MIIVAIPSTLCRDLLGQQMHHRRPREGTRHSAQRDSGQRDGEPRRELLVVGTKNEGQIDHHARQGRDDGPCGCRIGGKRAAGC